MRRFVLLRTGEYVAEGVQFSNKTVSLRWFTEDWNVVLYYDIKWIEEFNDTKIIWIDDEDKEFTDPSN